MPASRFLHPFHFCIIESPSSVQLLLHSQAIASPLAHLDWTLCNPLLQCFEFLSLLPPLITLILIRLTAALESIVRALSRDDDVIVRRAAASALLISLRPYNVDDGKTVAMIAGANLRFVRPPRFTSHYKLSPPSLYFVVQLFQHVEPTRFLLSSYTDIRVCTLFGSPATTATHL
jgi:hypothetical protein